MKIKELKHSLNITITRKGAVVHVDDTTSPEYRALWKLDDYVVTSVCGATINLRRRRVNLHFERAMEQQINDDQVYGHLTNFINQQGSFR